MDSFLPARDELSTLIQAQAETLYARMRSLDAASLGMPAHCLAYFASSHSKRLFFSIETSAHLLYRSISLTGRLPGDLVVMDYGAGVGTLYVLAKMIGCRVIYNDHLEDWKTSALLIAEAVQVNVDHYIVGDIGQCLDRLDALGLRCDIITSRNVIEHIYKLDVFYETIRRRQPQALVYSSTTANINNPASVIKHRLWHARWEKVFRGKRIVVIERQAPGLSPAKRWSLAKATRGLAMEDLQQAIEAYRRTGALPDPRVHGSNTCDPTNGVWAEHLIGMHDYRRRIGESRFTVSFAPGFWDTHYPNGLMNQVSRALNDIIRSGGKKALTVSPFIYVIASPR